MERVGLDELTTCRNNSENKKIHQSLFAGLLLAACSGIWRDCKKIKFYLSNYSLIKAAKISHKSFKSSIKWFEFCIIEVIPNDIN